MQARRRWFSIATGLCALRADADAGVRPRNNHHDFGLKQSKIMKRDRFIKLKRDAGAKPLHTFPHPALGFFPETFSEIHHAHDHRPAWIEGKPGKTPSRIEATQIVVERMGDDAHAADSFGRA